MGKAERRRSVHASIVNKFKNRIDKYLVRSGYTNDRTSALSVTNGFHICRHLRCSLDGNLVLTRLPSI